MDDGRWGELQPQVKRRDDGNSHHRMLDIYMRMLAEYRRIVAGRSRGFDPDDFLLSKDELQQVAEARVYRRTADSSPMAIRRRHSRPR